MTLRCAGAGILAEALRGADARRGAEDSRLTEAHVGAGVNRGAEASSGSEDRRPAEACSRAGTRSGAKESSLTEAPRGAEARDWVESSSLVEAHVCAGANRGA